MGTTPTLKLPYPESTDPVAQGAAAIRSLADKLDAITANFYSSPPTGCTLPAGGGTLGYGPSLSISSQPYTQTGFVYLSGLITTWTSGRVDLSIRDSTNTVQMTASAVAGSVSLALTFPFRLGAGVGATYNPVVTGTAATVIGSDPRWARFYAIAWPGF